MEFEVDAIVHEEGVDSAIFADLMADAGNGEWRPTSFRPDADLTVTAQSTDVVSNWRRDTADI